VPENYIYNFTATGIGSLPHVDPFTAIEVVTRQFTDMPYWPQLPQRSLAEHMNFQYALALKPLIKVDLSEKSLNVHPDLTREKALAIFYERIFNAKLEDFALIPKHAAAFFLFINKLLVGSSNRILKWVKGHIVGPLTLAGTVLGVDGKALLYDDELAEAIAKGLGVAAAAQVQQLLFLKRPIIIFVDEPILAGYGSAFISINREKVLALLALFLKECRRRVEVVLGIHCCGNTDWGLLIDAGFDIISLDSVDFGQNLLLYSESLQRFFIRGGTIAWGAIPTNVHVRKKTAWSLWEDLRVLLEKIIISGVSRSILSSQALITPACGLGSLTEEQAAVCLELTYQVSKIAKKCFI